ncbi:hypothetical protein ACFW3D_31925 [Streptomyces sp. NPDC058864]
MVCWLLWTAVTWAVADWRWTWFLGYAAVVPALAYGIVWAWGEARSFAPSRQRETWATAVLAALALAAPVVVLTKGWGTALVALLFSLASGAVGLFVPGRPNGERGNGEATAFVAKDGQSSSDSALLAE